MFGRISRVLILLLVPFTADTPAPTWVLVPAELETVNLCIEECDMKVRWVTRYEWRQP